MIKSIRTLSILAAGALALVVLLPIELWATLFYGWIPFVIRVLPKVRFNGATVGFSLAVAAAFALGVHWLACKCYAQRDPATGDRLRFWRAKWTLAVVAAVFLTFAAGICMIGVAHQTTWLMTYEEPFYGAALHFPFDRDSPEALHELGSSMNAYADVWKAPPPVGHMAEIETLHSWETHLLPFGPYEIDDIRFELPWNAPENARPFKCIISQFVNPDLEAPPFTDPDGYGLSHYSMNVHLVSLEKPLDWHALPDGQAHTLLIGEINANFQPWAKPGNWRDPARGINRSAYGFGGVPGSGGAHFVMADGSVRFLKERIDPAVLRALSTPSGEEKLPTDEVDYQVVRPQ